MISLSLSGLVALALSSLALMSAKRFTATATSAELAANSRTAVDRFTADLRQMTSVTSFTTNSVVVIDKSSNATTYSYFPATRKFQRIRGNETITLLSECDWLNFSMYSANPIDGVLDIQPTAKLKECKAIKVQWTCTRTNWNSAFKANVNASQTVVLRAKGI